MIDWVPCQNYDDDPGIINNGATLEYGLLNPSAWSADVEIVGDIEGEDEGYKVLRIVGYFSAWYDPQEPSPPTSGQVYVRLWPGFQDQANQLPITPGVLAGAGAGRAANEKWWWERVMHGPGLDRQFGWEFQPVNHPWHFFCDVKPNFWVNESMVPTLTIQNATDRNIRFSHRFRMLVAKKG